jgi:hypothetical protein
VRSDRPHLPRLSRARTCTKGEVQQANESLHPVRQSQLLGKMERFIEILGGDRPIGL